MNLYGPVRAAEFEGTAEVLLTFPTWAEGAVEPTVHEIAVLPPKAGPKPDPVTERLLRTLPLSDRKAMAGVVRFSPDGARLLIAGYPTGTVQLWDTKTWTEAVRIDTPAGTRYSWEYVVPTPDWKSLLIHHRTRKVVKDDRDGKVTERLQVDGRIDRYSAATGKLIDTIPMADRGPVHLQVLPSGMAAVVPAEGSFAATDRVRPALTELVDLKAKTAVKLFDTQATLAVAPDGVTAFTILYRNPPGGPPTSELVKYDLTKRAVTAVKERPDPETYFAAPVLSPDGKRLVVFTGWNVKGKTESSALLVLDPSTFAEVARVPAGDKVDASAFEAARFTADGKTVVAKTAARLLVWEVAAKKVTRDEPLPAMAFSRLLLSDDGKRAAVVGMPPFDRNAVGRNPDPLDLPQPRAVLIDLTDAKAKPAVLVLPHGTTGDGAFSSDGKTLAVGGLGGVVLLDLSK